MIKDPPFSKLDLISCRNLLIYMGGDLQKKIIPLFHYALNSGGFLFLGTSETVGDFGDLFMALDRKAKLYQRREDFHSTQRATLGRFLPPLTGAALPRVAENRVGSAKFQLRELTEQALLQQTVPAAVLVNSQGNILYLHGRTGMYLEPAPGEAGINNILKMAREGLRRELTTALHKSVGVKEIVSRSGLRVKTNGDFTTVNLTIRPVTARPELAEWASPAATPEALLYLVILEQVPPLQSHVEMLNGQPSSSEKAQQATALPASVPGSDTDARIVTLKKELQAKEEYLQTANEELETSNEELKSSNEEMQSVNEELQSTNEELETSKEELQSVNEELATFNAELQTKVADLSQANNDMNNLLAGTGIATVFVDHGLRILRFTPSATRVINLILSDVGRPVGHIVSNLLGYDRLVTDTKAVLDTLVSQEVDVQTMEGKWYSMRIQPYRTLDNVIEGAVITFVDITKAKKTQDALLLNEERMRVALQAASQVIFNQDTELNYTWIHNPDAQLRLKAILGKTDADFLSAEDAANLTTIKRLVIESGKGTRQEVRITLDGKPDFYDLTVEPLRDAVGLIIGITCAMMIIKDRRPQDLMGMKDRQPQNEGD